MTTPSGWFRDANAPFTNPGKPSVPQLSEMTWLLVGVDSFLGATARDYLAPTSEDIISSSRTGNGADIRIDLCNPQHRQIPSTSNGTAVFFSAITGHERARDGPRAAHVVNVTGTINVLSILAEKGWRVVFVSSEAAVSPSPMAPQTPRELAQIGRNVYGVQKGLVEAFLADQLPGYSASVRLSKVLNRTDLLWSEWLAALRRNEPIVASSTKTLRPLSPTTAVEALVAVGRHRDTGLYLASPDWSITYLDLVVKVRDSIGSISAIKKQKNSENEAWDEATEPAVTPQNVSGWVPPTVDDVLRYLSA